MFFVKKISLYCILLYALLAITVGCGDEPAPSSVKKGSTTAAKAKKAKKQSVAVKKKDVEKKKEKYAYSYDPSGKKDPFFPIIVEKTVEKDEDLTKVNSGEPKTYLETLDLSQLKLVAVMLLGTKNIAMVEDPEGKGHTAYIGTPMGKNGGKVVSIADGKVLIEEKYKKKGKVVPVIRELIIQSVEGKKR